MHFPHETRGAVCDICREEVKRNELIHLIDGFVICPECFFDFVFDYFQENLMTVAEMLELTKPENDT